MDVFFNTLLNPFRQLKAKCAMAIDFDVNERYCARPETDIRQNRDFPCFDVNVTPLTASDSVLARQGKGELAVIVAGGFFRKEGGGSITGKTKRAGHKSTAKNEHP